MPLNKQEMAFVKKNIEEYTKTGVVQNGGGLEESPHAPNISQSCLFDMPELHAPRKPVHGMS